MIRLVISRVEEEVEGAGVEQHYWSAPQSKEGSRMEWKAARGGLVEQHKQGWDCKVTTFLLHVSVGSVSCGRYGEAHTSIDQLQGNGYVVVVWFARVTEKLGLENSCTTQDRVSLIGLAFLYSARKLKEN